MSFSDEQLGIAMQGLLLKLGVHMKAPRRWLAGRIGASGEPAACHYTAMDAYRMPKPRRTSRGRTACIGRPMLERPIAG